MGASRVRQWSVVSLMVIGGTVGCHSSTPGEAIDMSRETAQGGGSGAAVKPTAPASANGAISSAYSWGRVAIGGGGFVPVITIHPKVPDVIYIAADVGGMDRWDPVNQQWIPLTGWIRRDDPYGAGIAAIAVDPSDETGNIVYAAVGTYDWAPGAIMKSMDRGDTWTRYDAGGQLYFLSNGDQGHPQHLAVDPANPDIIYAASRNGLFRSMDGAATWAPLSGPTGDTTELGVGCCQSGDQVVIIDPSSGTVPNPTRTRRLFVAPYVPWPAPYVQDTSAGARRADFSGWSGIRITVGQIPITLGSLGRWRIAGSTQLHTIRVTDAASGVDVPGASTVVNMAGASDDSFVYADLPAPVVLAPGGIYYITSEETAGGDPSYDADSTLTTQDNAGAFSVDGPASLTTSWTFAANPDHGFGPLDVKFVWGAHPTQDPLYKTEDGADTWQPMPGAPVSVDRAAISSSGTLYCTSALGVYKYSGGPSGSWTTITPPEPGAYAGVAIDPFDENRLVTEWGFPQWHDSIWRSTNGGTSWEDATGESTPVPWFLGGIDGFLTTVEFDPFHRGTAWALAGESPWKTPDVYASLVEWTGYVKGHEELVSTGALISPPSGPIFLYSGNADFPAFSHTSLSETATPVALDFTRFGYWNTISGADFEEANPRFVAFVGHTLNYAPGGGGYTTDGMTYNVFPAVPEVGPDGESATFGGRIAVSADSQDLVWLTGSTGKVYYSSDLGASWGASDFPGVWGLIAWHIFDWRLPLCSDRKNGAKFYVYDWVDGVFYRSEDRGHTFTPAATGLPIGSFYWGGKLFLFPSPTTEGELWLSIEYQGLWHSTDSGTTWTQVDTVQTSYLAGIGKGPDDQTPSLYLMGNANGDTVEGIYRSDDRGATWVRIDIPDPYPTSAVILTGDRQTYGQLYVGTGMGLYYGTPVAGPPAAPTGLLARTENGHISVSWDPPNPSTSAASFSVLRSTTSGSDYSPVATGLTVKGYTDAEVTAV
jgi:hypothetical protein